MGQLRRFRTALASFGQCQFDRSLIPGLLISYAWLHVGAVYLFRSPGVGGKVKGTINLTVKCEILAPWSKYQHRYLIQNML